MFKLIGEIVVVYLLYVVIFNFIVPLYRASKQMKSTMNNFSNKMKDQQAAQHSGSHQEPVKPNTKNDKGDYIDYEEVK